MAARGTLYQLALSPAPPLLQTTALIWSLLSTCPMTVTSCFSWSPQREAWIPFSVCTGGTVVCVWKFAPLEGGIGKNCVMQRGLACWRNTPFLAVNKSLTPCFCSHQPGSCGHIDLSLKKEPNTILTGDVVLEKNSVSLVIVPIQMSAPGTMEMARCSLASSWTIEATYHCKTIHSQLKWTGRKRTQRQTSNNN